MKTLEWFIDNIGNQVLYKNLHDNYLYTIIDNIEIANLLFNWQDDGYKFYE